MEKSPKTYSQIISNGALKEMADMLAKSECENLKLKRLLKEYHELLFTHGLISIDSSLKAEVIVKYK